MANLIDIIDDATRDLSEQTSPDITADFVAISQTSDTSPKKVKLQNLVGTVLAAVRSVFTPASASGPASLQLHEDTDNGTNKVTISAPSSLASDRAWVFPDAAGTFASQAYADALVAGLSWKQAVRVASTAAVTLATAFENGDTIDGVVLATGDRILVKDQADPKENGIYIVAASGAPSRATDADSGTELVNASCYVQEGTANADKQFVCTTNATITIGVTNIVFAEFSAGSGTAASTTEQLTGTSSTKSSTPDSVAALWEKGADIASSGTISVGEGGFFHITGTTTITDIDFGTDKSGRKVWFVFDGILTLTHHSTTLILPTGANITTAAGDVAVFVSEDGSDNVRCLAYFRKDGTPLTAGPAYGKQTVYVPAAAMISATTNGPSTAQLESASNKLNYSVLDFDGTTQEYAHFQVAFPKSWDESTVTFKAFWGTTNTGTAGIAIGLQGIAASDGDTIDTAFGTAVYVTDAGQSSAAKQYVTSESGAVTIGGTPAEGDMVYFRVTRDPSNGSDTMTEDMRLIGIQLFFTTNANNDA